MHKAVFIDRDGVINNDTNHYYIYQPQHFELNHGVIEALSRWQKKGFLLIVISNQGGISKGIYKKADVERVHQKLTDLLEKEGITLHEIYYCPHHDKHEKCLCRKPSGLMIEKALARFSVDASQSYMVGDSHRDIEAARNAGVKGIKIEANQNLLTVIDGIK